MQHLFLDNRSPSTNIMREVVKVKAKKINGLLQTETKKFCIDPQLTNLIVLRDLLKRAFSLLNNDFVVSYLEETTNGSDVAHYLPMLSEWDLNTALEKASEPYLFLKIDSKPFEIGQDEWDILDSDEFSVTEGLLKKDAVNLQNVATSVNAIWQKAWFNSGANNGSNILNNLTRRITSSTSSSANIPRSQRSPINDVQFRSFLDGDGRLLHEKKFRLCVYQNGLEPSLRAVVWRHLLNVYPKKDDVGMSGKERIAYTKRLAEKYYSLKASWLNKFQVGYVYETLRLVANAVRKDVIRTDRTHEFYAGDDDRNKNVLSLFYLLVTYALTHPEIGYCQGMSDLASPILVVMKDEAQAYICFCALMRRMKRNFESDGDSMIRKFCHLKELLQFYDPTFHEYLREMSADDLLFCYRWLLLDLKREFSFDDALILMEVMWASLPPDPPDNDDVSSSYLFDCDITICGGDDDLSTFSVRSSEENSFTDEIKNETEDVSDDDVWKEEGVARSFPNTMRSYRSFSTSIPFAYSDNKRCPDNIIQSLKLLNKKFANVNDKMSRYDVLSSNYIGNAERRRRYTLNEASLLLPDDFESQNANFDSSVILRTTGAYPKCSTSKSSPIELADEAISSNSVRFGDQRHLTMSEISDICLLKPSVSSSQLATTTINERTTDVDETHTMTNSVSAPCLHDKFPSDEKLNDDSNEFSSITKPSNNCLLSPPDMFGDGNPFMLFVCLTLLLQHRDVIMRNRMDFNEIAVYFDKLVRKHKVHRVLKRARIYFADYLKSNWFERPTDQ